MTFDGSAHSIEYIITVGVEKRKDLTEKYLRASLCVYL